MKDAKGHGSDAHGAHSAGVDQIGTTRYHDVEAKHWDAAQKRGYLDPTKYTDKKIWTSEHPDKWYRDKFGVPHALEKGTVNLAITLHPRYFHEPPGGGSADRVTNIKIPTSRVQEVERGTYERR